MAFTSLIFALFLGIALFFYYTPPLRRFQWVVLLISSYFFYIYNTYKYTVFIVLTTLTIYLAAKAISKVSDEASKTLKEKKAEWGKEEKKKYKKEAEKKKKLFVSLALLINFGILFVLKYMNFLIGGLALMLGSQQHDMHLVSLLLPLGISFYTFQATGYLIDVYRGTVEAENNFFKFALFVSFFPQIIQGPISTYEKLGSQLYSKHKAEWYNFKLGGELILWGLFKKLVIADRMFASITQIAEEHTSYAGQMLLLAVLMYALQLYADFSGGIDIARGVARLFGIRIEDNFCRPYFSKSISEYWRRWHITLGAWMKKYVFYTLAVSEPFLKLSKLIGKSKIGSTAAGKHIAKTTPTAMASFIVFMLIGIWHGANSKYIGFGLWNGTIIMISTLLAPVYEWALKKIHINSEAMLWKLFQMLRTFVVVAIGYYFDIAPSLTGALDMIKRSITDCHLPITLSQFREIGLYLSDIAVIIYGMVIMLYFSIRLEKTHLETPGDLLNQRPAWLQWVVILIGALSIIVLGMYGSGSEGTDFVYMGF